MAGNLKWHDAQQMVSRSVPNGPAGEPQSHLVRLAAAYNEGGRSTLLVHLQKEGQYPQVEARSNVAPHALHCLAQEQQQPNHKPLHGVREGKSKAAFTCAAGAKLMAARMGCSSPFSSATPCMAFVAAHRVELQRLTSGNPAPAHCTQQMQWGKSGSAEQNGWIASTRFISQYAVCRLHTGQPGGGRWARCALCGRKRSFDGRPRLAQRHPPADMWEGTCP